MCIRIFLVEFERFFQLCFGFVALRVLSEGNAEVIVGPPVLIIQRNGLAQGSDGIVELALPTVDDTEVGPG